MSVKDGTEYRVVWYSGGSRRVVIKQTKRAAEDLVRWIQQNRLPSVSPWIEVRSVSEWRRA